MFWRKPIEPAAPLDEKALERVEQILAQSLREYETLFFKKASNAFDEGAEHAKAVVAAARTLISESRLGYALTRSLLEHVRHWPSWSKHSNFSDYCSLPFRYIGGSAGSETSSKTTVVDFTFNDTPYTVRFIEEGMSGWDSEDANLYGKVELISDDKTVLGLDVTYDLGKGDTAYWLMTEVYALLPGPWMKELLEMAASIDGKKNRETEEVINRDAIERAKNIKLPG